MHPARASGGEREFAINAADALESASVLRSLAAAPPLARRSHSGASSSEWTVVEPEPAPLPLPPQVRLTPAPNPSSIPSPPKPALRFPRFRSAVHER